MEIEKIVSAAEPKPGADARKGDVQVVIFTLGAESYGVEIGDVWEINTMQPITHIPRAPEAVEGVMNLRGEIVPVMDLRKRLGLPPKADDRSTRIMVVQAQESRLGLIVDDVREVLRIGQEAIEPPGQVSSLIDDEFLWGIAKQAAQLVVLLDLKRLLSRQEQEEIDELQPA